MGTATHTHPSFCMTSTQDISSRWCKVDVLVIQYIHGSIISRDWNIHDNWLKNLKIWCHTKRRMCAAMCDPSFFWTMHQMTPWTMHQMTPYLVWLYNAPYNPLNLIWLNNAQDDPLHVPWTMHQMTPHLIWLYNAPEDPLPYQAGQCTI